jgi:hypothetical protein
MDDRARPLLEAERLPTLQPPNSSPQPFGADAYQFDPSLRIQEQSGLDRLRCIEDRELADVLYRIYMLREEGGARGSSAPAPRTLAPRTIGIRVLATRALTGELGFAAQELATNLLVDESGRENVTERTLQDFARAFRNLQRV